MHTKITNARTVADDRSNLSRLFERQLGLVSGVMTQQIRLLAERNAASAAESSSTLLDHPLQKDTSLFSFEQRPLHELIAAGELQKADGAAVGYLPDEALDVFPATRTEIVETWLGSAPKVGGILTTPVGRLALITAPFFLSDLLTDRKRCVRLLARTIRLAGEIGAQFVSLVGLIPAATEYGRVILAELDDRSETPGLTTGHATTAAAVLLTVEKVLAATSRSITRQSLGCLGLGSIGTSVLRSMLALMAPPKEILLCDLPAKEPHLHVLADQARSAGYSGSIRIMKSDGHVPAEFYQSSLIVGAAGVGAALDIEKVAPGTIVVDDSAPHCFNVDDAVSRMDRDADIVVTEGGVLRAPAPMKMIASLPASLPAPARIALSRAMLARDPQELTGCNLAALLPSISSSIRPSIGIASVVDCLENLRTLRKLGFESASLQCSAGGSWTTNKVTEQTLHRFRRRFGDRSLR